MKKKLLLLVMCLATSMAMMAQKSYNFNAVALNVDGLPEKISGITINEGAPGSAGATALGQGIAASGWEIVGLSEDFNYHSELVAPLADYYGVGEHGGTVKGTSNNTDGLGFLCLKSMSFEQAAKVQWEKNDGSLLGNLTEDNGADELIKKGFRRYTVTIASGVQIDVYVLHMDAASRQADITTREAQLTQLATYIKNNKNGRPVLIIGDTNCRYTREKVKTGFIDVINADSRLTIKDAWIEHMWGGAYPTYGSDAMMTHTYGDQKGEIVDKIFYINDSESNLTITSNSYLHDTSFGNSDHWPVVVNFTLTDKSASPLTDAQKEENWTLEEKAKTNEKPTWEGEQVVSGTTYYLMNVGTEECLRVGGAWFTEGVAGKGGMQVTPTTANGGTTWVLNTYRGKSLGTGDVAFTDQSGEWYLEPVAGTAYQYRLKNTGGTYLTATTENEHPVKNLAGNASDDNQKWIFLTDARIRTEMTKANADYPFNFTSLLKSANFDVIEYEDGWTNNWTGFNQSSGPFKASSHNWGGDAMAYSAYAYANQAAAAEMSQNLGTLPNGVYNVSFKGFYRSRTSSADETIAAKVTFGSAGSIDVQKNTGTNIGDFGAACEYFKVANNTYTTSKQMELASASSVTLTVSKPKSNNSGWICVDDFQLLYYGTGVVVDEYKAFKDQVLAKVNATYAEVLKLSATGQAAYDISSVVYLYNNDLIQNKATADALCAKVDEAYAAAVIAQNTKVVEDAISGNGDVTGVIVNPSFETGDLTGWTVTSSTDVGVYLNSNGTYTMSKVDGSYVYNSWNGDENTASSAVKQTIKGLPNGLYELKAYLASFGKADGKPVDYTVFLTGNKRHVGVKADGGKTVSQEATLYFLVEDGTAEIGAVGGDTANGGESFAYYDYRDGSFFKADNFRLKYICDVPNGRLKIALEDIKATPLDYYGQAALDIATYETKFANKAVTGDGKSDANAVYAAMKTATKAQKTVNADMTWAIENPSFETGEFSAWKTTVGWETIVGTIYDRLYAFGADGNYLFNTWNDFVDAANSGVNAPISQDITGLPNGTYRLTAMLGSGSGNTLYVDGNGTKGTVTTTAGEGTLFKASVDFVVADGTATIKAGGNNDCWYKADDFRLTLVAPAELVLNETDTEIVPIENVTYPKVTLNRTIKPNTWSTFVSPFDIPASVLEDWDVKELSSATENAGHVSLVFTDSEDGIKKGVPYMVRNTSLGENLTVITMENVEVNTVALNNVDGGAVKFVGQYISENVPVGDFFISNNTFYKAAHENNTMKGFRARFVPASAGVKSLAYSFDDVDFTGIEGVEGNAAEIIAIYGVDGTLRSDLQKGINIVKMSNGTTKKVLVK